MCIMTEKMPVYSVFRRGVSFDLAVILDFPIQGFIFCIEEVWYEGIERLLYTKKRWLVTSLPLPFKTLSALEMLQYTRNAYIYA